MLLGITDPGNYPEMVTPCRFYGDDWVKKSLIFGASLENSAMWMQHHLACDRVLIEDIKVWNL